MTSCPFCTKPINLGTKAQTSIKALAPGKMVRIKCPNCSGTLSIDNKFQAKKVKEPANGKTAGKAKTAPAPANYGVKPPEPPDISWLNHGLTADSEEAPDDEATMAMVLVKPDQGQKDIVGAIEGLGYRVELVSSAQEAIEKMAFKNYAMVALHAQFEGQEIKNNSFHKHMEAMKMASRRYIFYFLIGSEFHTLYELEALAFSANLVVNERDLAKLNILLMKKIPEYERLFGQLIEEIRNHGKIL